MKRIITTVLIAMAIYTGLTVSSCSSPDTGGVEQFFADVQPDSISIQDVSGLKEISYSFCEVNTYRNEETGETQYRIYSDLRELSFFPENKDFKKGVFTVYTIQPYTLGAGIIDSDSLKLYSVEEIPIPDVENAMKSLSNFTAVLKYTQMIQRMQYAFKFNEKTYGIPKNTEVVLSADVSNLAQFRTVKKNEMDTIYEIFTHKALYDTICAKTPEIVYQGPEDMRIRLSFFALPDVRGAKAVVSGTIENPTNDFKRQYEEEYGEWIYSVMTDGDYFRSGMTAEGESYIGPRIHWSPSKLIVEGNKEKEIPEIVLTRKK
ncbi:MAG: hypothetical protein K2K76_08120 [Muribaculaceae bacterium]|nr:hypothetical protein [Muribaculaceae bacterium]